MTRLAYPEHHRSPHVLTSLVAGVHGISVEDFASPDPHPDLARARQDLIILLTEYTALNFGQIGVALGNRSASTIHGLHRAAMRAEQESEDVRHRRVRLRDAALNLPEDVSIPESVVSLARSVIMNPQSGTTFERMATGLLGAAEVLNSPDITDSEARYAALQLLAGPGRAPVIPSCPIEYAHLKGYVA